jgi:ABC-type multidrug transport system ATPase subunit
LLGSSGCGKTTLLSCIVGILDLDGGEIKVFGQTTGQNLLKGFGHKIGFMPQQNALIDELSIKETIYYFGNIFQMEKDKLRERYQMLRNLLELPHDDHRIEDCSGGQQRRVSFAAAMIHEPELLILDEPTVGLDPILREKIWDFMLHVTRTSKLAIIITTHYIEEAKSADRCGLMRNGILLAEDSPRSILDKYGCQTLEEAFLKLCTKSSEVHKNLENFQNDSRDDSSQTILSKSTLSANLRKKFTLQTMSALVSKNFLQIRRQPA